MTRLGKWRLSLSPKEELVLFFGDAPVAKKIPLSIETNGTFLSLTHVFFRRNVLFARSADGKVELFSRFRNQEAAGLSTLVEEVALVLKAPLARALFSFRVRLLPQEKPRDLFWVIPGLWYGDNEAWNTKVPYPKGLDENWSFRADGSPAPGVVVSGKKHAYGVGLDEHAPFAVKQAGLEDVWGVGFEWAEKNPTALFTFPPQEAPKAYPRGRKLDAPKKPRMDFSKNLRVRFRFFHHAGSADKAFHTRVWRARLVLAKAPPYAVSRKKIERTAQRFVFCLKNSHFRKGLGFSHRHDVTEIFTGWCGGFAAAFAAVRWGDVTGDEVFRRMGLTMADFLCRTAQASCGLFRSEYLKGFWFNKTVWAKGKGIPVRNPSEGCCYLALLLEYEASQGRRHDDWRRALAENLEVVLKAMQPNGCLPQEIHPKTGKGLSWVGATPAAWVGALAVFSRLERGGARARRYLSAAKKIASFYLKHYVNEERYIGGPYDTYMAPNMEDPYNLLLAYCELHRTTGEKKWLEASRKIADHLLSWRYVSDARFPKGTVCAKHRVRTFAMSPASVSNKHIQNWDAVAGPYLFYLTKKTGDSLYARQAWEHLKASTQLVQEGNLPKGIPFGGQSEQWYATDFNWFGDCGKYSKGNLWQVSVCLPKAGFLITLAERKAPFVLRENAAGKNARRKGRRSGRKSGLS